MQKENFFKNFMAELNDLNAALKKLMYFRALLLDHKDKSLIDVFLNDPELSNGVLIPF